jgi:hypothetical protein
MRRAPSAIKIRMRGGRYRTYVPVSSGVECVGCDKSFDSLDTLTIHIPTCEDHPLYVPLSPHGENPQQILDRLAKTLNCEPHQVCDRVIRMLEERANGKAAT